MNNEVKIFEEKNLIFGLGTGRSGTMSLAKLLDLQHHAYFVHEGAYNVPKWLRHTTGNYLPWEFDKEIFESWFQGLHTISGNTQYIGDIGASVLPYVEKILYKNSSAKFICIKRNRDLVVKSFLKITRGTNHWKKNVVFKELNYFDKMFPKMNASSKKEAIEKYWDMYYKRCEQYSIQYPNNVFIFDISELNTNEGRQKILTVAGIAPEDMVTDVTVHANRSYYALPHFIFQIFLMILEIPRRIALKVYHLSTKQ